MSEAGAGLSARGWSRTTGTWCKLMGAVRVPQTVCEASEYEGLGQGWGIDQAKGLCLYPEEPMSMGCLWDEGVSAACLLLGADLDEPANRGPTRQVRGPGSGQGY